MPEHQFIYNPVPDIEWVNGIQVTKGVVAETGFALPTTSTAAAGMLSFINPLTTAVFAEVTVNWTTAGTGTYDIGISDDGTGADVSIIDGGTMAVGSVTAVRAVATLGATGPRFYLAASGTAGDSIVGQHSDTETSTAVGRAVIRYWPA